MSTSTAPIAQLDLVAELARLRVSPMPHKYIARTVLHNDDLRMVLMALREGAQLAPHHAGGTLVLQVLEGRMIVSTPRENVALSARQVLVLEGHAELSIVAAEDGALLLSVPAPAKH